MEFEVNGRQYHAGKMNAMDQFQVLRRMAPVMGPFVEFMAKLGERAKANQPMNQSEMMQVATPLAKAIGDLSDEVTNYIFDKCLSLVARQEPGDRGFARVWNSQAKRLQMEDIDLPTMMQIVLKVVEGSFENFFLDPLLFSNGPPGQMGGPRLNS